MTLLDESPHTRFTASSFAPQPPEARGLERDEVRLLVATPDGLSHGQFRDLPEHLRAGDVLVVNTSAAVNAEIDAVVDGSSIVLHVAHRLDDGDSVVELRTAPEAARAVLDAAAGDVVTLGDVRLLLRSPWPTEAPSSPTGTGNRLWRASVRGDLDRQPRGTAARSPTATSTGATRSRPTRPSSARTPAARRWPRPDVRSPTPS